MIQNIKIEKLFPHPKNPRKDVGAITELSDSIRANGVMQNLTVVPIPEKTDSYYVVIGNRRLAASKLAGLKELPCVISLMDEQTQQSTMLLENMQRVDLTPYEQAEGFQMCLDLGMSEDTLKEKTGFSKKTIKHRLNLLKLDQEKFKKGIERGATLQDYIDLEQIEDNKIKEDLLNVIGTSNYRFRLNNELGCQSNKKKTEEFIAKLKTVMEQVNKKPDGYVSDDYIYGTSSFSKYNLPADLDVRKYVFVVFGGSTIEIYREVLDSEEVQSVKKEEPKPPTQEELDIIEIKKKAVIAYKTRLQFAKNTYSSLVNSTSKNIEFRYIVGLLSDEIKCLGYGSDSIFKEVSGKDLSNIRFKECKEFDSLKFAIPLMFSMIYSQMESDRDDVTLVSFKWSDNYGQYDNNRRDEIKELYDFLSIYGYESSDEEYAIMFGTHELYKKEDAEEGD